MERETVGSIVKDETTRQTVIFVFSVIGGVAVVWAMRAASTPDLWRTFKMRKALFVKRAADAVVEKCQTISANAATAYNQEKA